MGTCILLLRGFGSIETHTDWQTRVRYAEFSGIPRLSYARRSIVLRLPVQENPVVRVTPTDSLWIFPPSRETSKSSRAFSDVRRIYKALKCKTKSQELARYRCNATSSILEVKIYRLLHGRKTSYDDMPSLRSSWFLQQKKVTTIEQHGNLRMAPIANRSVLIWIRYFPPLVVVHGSFLSVNVLSFDRIHISIAIIALAIVALTHRVK